MDHSSKANPCPVCGRDKDDKCRWNDSFIFCYQGDSYSPPDLRVGQTLEVPGWPRLAVVGLQGGFAGASVVLAPDDGDEARWRPQGPQRSSTVTLSVALFVSDRIRVLRSNLRKLRDCPELEYQTTDSLLEYKQLGEQIEREAEELYSLARAHRFAIKRYKQIMLNLKDSLKTARYFNKDICSFFNNHFYENRLESRSKA